MTNDEFVDFLSKTFVYNFRCLGSATGYGGNYSFGRNSAYQGSPGGGLYRGDRKYSRSGDDSGPREIVRIYSGREILQSVEI